MTRRRTAGKTRTVQVFIVSWFPVYAKTAATIQCLSRKRAQAISDELKASFAPYHDYDPLIQIERSEAPVQFD